MDSFHQKELAFALKKKGRLVEAKQRLINSTFLDDKQDNGVMEAIAAIEKEAPGLETEGSRDKNRDRVEFYLNDDEAVSALKFLEEGKDGIVLEWNHVYMVGLISTKNGSKYFLCSL